MLLLFWIIAFGVAWAITVPLALAQLGVIDASPVPAGLGNLIGLAPAIAAFLAASLSGGAGRLGARAARFKAPSGSWFLALGLPVAWLIGADALREAHGAAGIDLSISAQLAVFAAIWLVLAFGEEIGWRAQALAMMTKRSGFWRAATILGVIWAVWHYPKLLSRPFVTSIPQAAPLILQFTLQIILANYVLCWLFLRSLLSTPVGATFHASFNVVATAYPLAGVDPYLTAAVAFCVLLILIFDRNVGFDDTL
jgi:membrane protease YdiL (CAAX protease family)